MLLLFTTNSKLDISFNSNFLFRIVEYNMNTISKPKFSLDQKDRETFVIHFRFRVVIRSNYVIKFKLTKNR